MHLCSNAFLFQNISKGMFSFPCILFLLKSFKTHYLIYILLIKVFPQGKIIDLIAD